MGAEDGWVTIQPNAELADEAEVSKSTAVTDEPNSHYRHDCSAYCAPESGPAFDWEQQILDTESNK